MGRLLRQFLQGLVLAVFLAELGVFMYYFLGPNREQQYMISDRIFASGEYMAALSAFLGFRLLVVVVYSLNFVREQAGWVTTTFVASGMAAGGWAWLVTNHDDFQHINGVIVYCFFTGLYSVCLIKLVRDYYEVYRHVHDILEFTLLGLTLAGIPTFAWLWHEGFPEAYIPEHIAYAMFLLFMIVFFWYHPPFDVIDKKSHAKVYPDPETAAQCSPLLPPAGAILEMVAVSA